MSEIEEVRRDYGRATLALVHRARTNKEVDAEALAEARTALQRFSILLQGSNAIPVDLVGELWFPFTALLAEADHARDPEQLLGAAWDLEEDLRKIFGPHF